MPLFTGQYWFFTVYILLMLILPYINIMLSGISRRTYIELLVLCGILFSLIPSVNIFGDTFGTEYGYSLIWFVVLYLSAVYLKRFGIRKCNYGLCYLILGMTIFGIQLLMRYAQSKEYAGGITTLLNLQVQYNSPLVFAAAVCLFMSAISHPLNLNGFEKIFGKIASLSFAVYLFHENGSIRDILWNRWVCLKNEGDSAIRFAIRLVISVFLIFAVGIAIEWMRRVIIHLLNNVFMKCEHKRMSSN